MKLKLKLRSKLILSILTVVLVVYGLNLYEQFRGFKELNSKYAKDNALRIGQQNSFKIRSLIESKIEQTRDLAKQSAQLMNLPYNQRPEFVKGLIKNIAETNPQITSVWASVELRNLDPTYTLDYGRVDYTYYRESDGLKYLQETLDVDKEKISKQFREIKMLKKDILMNPYWYTYNKKDSILESSVGSPILVNNKFEGFIGFDFALNSFQSILDSIVSIKNTKAFLVSEDGTVVAATDENLSGMNVEKLFPSAGNKIVTNIKNKEYFSFEVDGYKDNFHCIMIPIQFKSLDKTWALGYEISENQLLGNSQLYINRLLLYSILGIIIIVAVILVISYQITKPLKKANSILNKLSLGKIDSAAKMQVNTSDEINDIANSTNMLIDKLIKTVEFAKEVGKGNLKAHFEPQGSDDVLGISLLEMKKNLEEAKRQEELRAIEDDKINWATKGFALFGELLRHNETNLEEFAYHILSNLIEYIKADVGGLFLLKEQEDGTKTIDLMASYAFDRRKFEEKSLLIGEGLVGRCVQESETIFLSEVPKGYLSIGSGLGEEKPNCILIVPLKLNDDVFGVIELAAFEVFEKHIIDFVEKIGVTIASTISTAKVNIMTKQLLEASKFQADELASQEEEMRQNMEELIATQEESARKSRGFENLMASISGSSYIVEYDADGYVITANNAILTLLGLRSENLIGLNIKELDKSIVKNYDEFWNKLKRGIPTRIKSVLKGNSKNIELYQTFIPIADEMDKVYKIMVIGYRNEDYELTESNQKNEKQAV